MSTFVDIRPIAHLTKRTTIVRIDEDFKVSVKENARDLHYNFTGLDVDNGQQLDGANVTDPIVYVRGIKEGTDSRLIIGVNCYYEEDNQTIPNAGLYYYSTKDHFDFEEVLQQMKGESTDGKTKAPDPMFTNPVQQFPTQVFNIAPGGTTLSANTANPPTAVSQRLYAQLGSTAARRNHLKGKLRDLLDAPNLIDWLNWTFGRHVNWGTTYGNSLTAARLNVLDDIIARPGSYMIFLEMMANIVSLDANLDSEQKFNLINGNLSLAARDLFILPDRNYYGTNNIHGRGGDRPVAEWTIRIFGAVAAVSPWAFTRTDWSDRENTLLTLSGAALGDTWIEWARS